MADAALQTKVPIAGALIAAGLAVQLAMSFWVHPIAFIVFLGIACPLVLAGMILFLWALVTDR